MIHLLGEIPFSLINIDGYTMALYWNNSCI